MVSVCLCWFSACVDVLSTPSSSQDSKKQNSSLKPIPDTDRITLSSFSSSKPYSTPVQQVSGVKRTVTLSGLSGHSVFLVTVNTSGSTVSSEKVGSVLSYHSEGTYTGAAQSLKSTADAGLTGPVSADAAASGVYTGDDGETIVRYDKSKKNEEIFDAIRSGLLGPPANPGGSGGNSGLLRSAGTVTPPSYTVGISEKPFWALGRNDTFKKFSATLRAQGTHSNVWVADNYYNSSSFTTVSNRITSKQANELAAKFDLIYEKETPIFGFEYGGGVLDTDPSYGGADGDPKIQILVYDIDEDYSSVQTGGTFGYFYSGDEYSQSELIGSNRSNQAEIFYVDAHFTGLRPELMYSTLAHEFQHMINFNQKTIKSNYNPNSTAGVWYNEMLSMLAEDLIDPLIGIDLDDSGHPVKARIPEFLRYYYFEDPTVWLTSSYTLVLHSYANAYALGAYLVRNFGGAALVKKIMSDTLVDTDSLDAALASEANPLRSEVNSFAAALSRYGETLLFNQQGGSLPDDVLSFNKTVTTKISGTDYTFSGFDIWTIVSDETKNIRGPYVYTTNEQYELKPRTMLLQSNSAWQNKCGTLKITLQPPAASGVELYVMVR